MFEHVALGQLAGGRWWAWALAIVFYDFCYYWEHRCGHESAVLWGEHVVHHQSQCYNLSTALRQTSSSALLAWIFFLPLAVAGVPPAMFGVAAIVDLLYQYWIHTELVGKLGWFDRWFASPSNHRVHHAVNDRYVDRNYGGIFMVWDRLFGTFVDETERCVYGTRAPLDSWDPLWANLEVYAELARKSRNAGAGSTRFRVWLKPPGWQPALRPAAPGIAAFRRRHAAPYDPPATRSHAGVRRAHLVAVILAYGAAALVLGSRPFARCVPRIVAGTGRRALADRRGDAGPRADPPRAAIEAARALALPSLRPQPRAARADARDRGRPGRATGRRVGAHGIPVRPAFRPFARRRAGAGARRTLAPG